MKALKDWVIFPGYKHKAGFVTFQNITVDMIRAVFFPRDFYEKYRYLGSVPYESKNFNNDIFHAMKPLVIYLDYLAKPSWCPRWFLRFLHLFGNDNSVVRMRNRKLSHLFDKITKGYGIWDYKTKWTNYDLRISIRGNDDAWWLSDAIENKFYRDGRNVELLERLEQLNPERAKVCKGFSNSVLEEELEKLGVSENNF